jgi:hypothetical protein
LIAGLVFAGFGFLGGLLLTGCAEMIYTAGRSVFDAHPIAPLVFAAVFALFGVSRR